MKTNWRKLIRSVHVHVAFVITGMVLIYAISGFLMNHFASWGWDASFLPVFSEMTEMHYNPNIIWTWFSDIFAIGLIIVALSGLFVIKGRNGIRGIGGIELLIGIAIPVIIYFLSTFLMKE